MNKNQAIGIGLVFLGLVSFSEQYNFLLRFGLKLKYQHTRIADLVWDLWWERKATSPDTGIRGDYEEYVGMFSGTDVATVACCDNKFVSMASSMAGVKPDNLASSQIPH
ncbi:unnamed protein product [Ceratitis capitata]|uniref:(Mediterranean fruit fly) hypothetical protein n=1 Tax=Ceratitis capitata TaxID=7213 RepID=A0A811UVE9_CERCA|nr:unnamed protein product [Ceratitis capitata]